MVAQQKNMQRGGVGEKRVPPPLNWIGRFLRPFLLCTRSLLDGVLADFCSAMARFDYPPFWFWRDTSAQSGHQGLWAKLGSCRRHREAWNTPG